MSKKIDKVSVITTFYNAEKFIVQAVNSVNAQQIKGFELEYVLVNDKSTDNSLEVLNKYIKERKNPNVQFVIIEPEENLGCGGARRYGIEHSTGDYLMFLDADDYYINSDFIYRAYNEIKVNHADIVEYGVIFNQGNGQQKNNTVDKRYVLTDYRVFELALFKDNAIKFNVWTKIYTRAIVNSYPYSDSREFEDVRTIPVWLSNAKKVIVMPSAEVNYRAASGSIIREDRLKAKLGTITAIAELFENPKLNCDYNILKAMYGRAMIDLESVLHNHSSNDPGFNEMSRLNTKMLKYIYPNNWQELTFHIEDEVQNNEEVLTGEDGKIDMDNITGWDK